LSATTGCFNRFISKIQRRSVMQQQTWTSPPAPLASPLSGTKHHKHGSNGSNGSNGSTSHNRQHVSSSKLSSGLRQHRTTGSSSGSVTPKSK
jgi:hypothetical protein